MVSVVEQIRQTLVNELNPVEIQVVDQSHLHEGHAGARPGGETHFLVEIVAPCFEGKGRIERHRMINEPLADLLSTRIHALSLKAFSPTEWKTAVPAKI